MIIPTVARTELVGYRMIVLAMLATGFLSFGVWAHHMFTTGMPAMTTGFFSAASMAVSVPAGIQVFSWIATYATGKPRFNAPGLFTMGAVIVFVTGGLTGVMVALVPFDWQVHDTYFVVAHLHYVLIGGMVFPLFAAFYYWVPMVSTHALSERLAKWVFVLMFVGINVAFMPMHLAGLMGMPRRVYTYLPEHGWALPNMISTVGAFMFAAGVLLFVIDMARNFRPRPSGKSIGNIYGAGTLEWLPAGLYNTRSIPVVTSRDPLWDDPSLADNVEQGRYFLPGSTTGYRETIVTSPIRAEPQYLQILPDRSAWPFASAIFTAGFFLALTVQAYTFSIASAVFAVIAMLRWLWETDRTVPLDAVDIGAGITVPVNVTGPVSHGWWAMIITLIVAGMIFTMGLFGLAYLWSNQSSFWQSPPFVVPALPVLGMNLAAIALALGGRTILSRGHQGWASAALITSALLAVIAIYLENSIWRLGGFDPVFSAQAGLTYSLQAIQGGMAAIGLLIALNCAARTLRGLVAPPASTSIDLAALFLAYCGMQGLIGALFPRMLGVG